jgi:cytochrome c oxidase assembly protein subunit 11
MSAIDKQGGAERGLPSHGRLVRRLVLVAVGMFGFGFAMWPLYNVFCDLTGLGGRGVKIAKEATPVAISDRQVKIRFDATVNSGLPWIFQAQDKSATVRLGEMSEALYLAMNPTDEAIAGHAVYNVTPPEASLYFVKTECFCFTEQVLDLPEHIREITLSYTFYRDQNSATLALVAADNTSPGKAGDDR